MIDLIIIKISSISMSTLLPHKYWLILKPARRELIVLISNQAAQRIKLLKRDRDASTL